MQLKGLIWQMKLTQTVVAIFRELWATFCSNIWSYSFILFLSDPRESKLCKVYLQITPQDALLNQQNIVSFYN